uniref:Thymidylate kinase n=1 Tax=Spongospora subterranea TaxID=70186 RepID=A0A0H5QIM5_9EUKA|eukprot:CRZ01497.1 hypothetical protein [Spongospora subterranea]
MGAERGAFILLEGIDRCGKSTQARRLSDALKSQGCRTEIINFPNRTTVVGKVIDEYLSGGTEMSDHAMHLLFSANRWEMSESITSKLSSGITLIVDRYVFSGIAFSVAKGLDMDWCRSCDIGLPSPDVTFLLDMPCEESKQRGGYGRERYENDEMQIHVRRIFQMLQRPEWKIINASRPVDVVHNEIRTLVNSDMDRISKSPIGYITAEL